MEINRKKLEETLDIPDDRLAGMIYSVVSAAGGSKMQCIAAAANAGKLKKKLLYASDQELEKLAGSLDPKLLSGILEALGGKER